MKISVVINTYNSEKFLEQVLEPLQNFDEILICDMYSTDKTLEIAEKYGCKIIFHEKINYVEPARNFAIQSAENEWILLIDSDEVIKPTLQQKIMDMCNTHTFSALRIPRKNYFMGKFMRSAYPDFGIRFFRKDKIYWSDEIHSIPKVEGTILSLPTNHDFAIEHLANDSISDILKKTENYTNAELFRRKSKNISIFKLIFSPFIRFIKMYFIKGGFLDGKEGYIFAIIKAHYKFYTLAKLLEKNKNER